VKNYFLKFLIKLFAPCIQKHPQTKLRKILVVATTALGDTLWATPAIESLRKSFPDAYIGVLTSSIGEQVLRHHPYISKIYLLKKFSLRLWKNLYREQFDTVLLFHASQRWTLPLCALIGAQKIIGTYGINKGLDCLLTDPMPGSNEHEIRRRLNMVEKAGGKITTEALSLFLRPEEKFPNLSNGFMAQIFKRSGRWVALHPGSKDAFKRWPEENFAALGRALKKQLNCEILITGTVAEEALTKRIADQIPGAHRADPKLPFRSFAALIDQMDLLICNDTGPFHVACALQKPVIGIYTSTDPKLCGGHRASHATVIAKKPTCTPCLRKKCALPFCFLQIGVDEVLNAALKLFIGGFA
jgi:heptosyltransferase-1